MGQAKNRGSFEQRRAAALAKASAIEVEKYRQRVEQRRLESEQHATKDPNAGVDTGVSRTRGLRSASLMAALSGLALATSIR